MVFEPGLQTLAPEPPIDVMLGRVVEAGSLGGVVIVDCTSFIPSCPSFFMAALIEPAIQSMRVGHMSPWDYPLLTTQGEQP